MTEVSLVLPLQDENEFRQVLMGKHQRGPGKGRWNGFGGKFELGETATHCAVRELKVEVGLIAKEEDLSKVAIIQFWFAGVHTFTCHVFTLREWEGEVTDSEEMKDCRFYFTRKLPKPMWPADHEWLDLAFDGKKICAKVEYQYDGSTGDSYKFGFCSVANF